jgi:outer membrane biosynthesis protein TonB
LLFSTAQASPENIEIVRGFATDLDTEAVKAVARWQCKSTERKGKPVAVRIKI